MSIPSFWVSLFRAFKSRRMSRSNTAIRTKRVARMQPRTVLQKVVLWIFPTRREYKMLFNKRHVLKKQATPKQRAFQRLAPKKQVWGIILYINDALNCTSRHLPSETICMLFCTFLRAEAGTTLGIFAPHMDPRRRNMNEAFVRWAQPMPSKMRLQILSLDARSPKSRAQEEHQPPSKLIKWHLAHPPLRTCSGRHGPIFLTQVRRCCWDIQWGQTTNESRQPWIVVGRVALAETCAAKAVLQLWHLCDGTGVPKRPRLWSIDSSTSLRQLALKAPKFLLDFVGGCWMARQGLFCITPQHYEPGIKRCHERRRTSWPSWHSASMRCWRQSMPRSSGGLSSTRLFHDLLISGHLWLALIYLSLTYSHGSAWGAVGMCLAGSVLQCEIVPYAKRLLRDSELAPNRSHQLFQRLSPPKSD